MKRVVVAAVATLGFSVTQAGVSNGSPTLQWSIGSGVASTSETSFFNKELDLTVGGASFFLRSLQVAETSFDFTFTCDHGGPSLSGSSVSIIGFNSGGQA